MKDFVNQPDLNEGFTRVTLPETSLPKPFPEPPFNKKFAGRWVYKTANGDVFGIISRYDSEDKKKSILPTSLWKNAAGEIIWRKIGFGEARPLFNLPRILEADADTRIVIVEGEKTAEAIGVLLPRAVGTTWSGGANAITKTDFSSLAAKNVTISADCDEAGEKAAQQLIPILIAAGVASLRILDTAKLGEAYFTNDVKVHREAVPKGYDLADAVAEGWTSERLNRAIKDDPSIIATVDLSMTRTAEQDPQLCEFDVIEPCETGHPDFEFTDAGLEKTMQVPKPKGEGFITKRTVVGGRLEVIGKANITRGRKWSTAVAFDAPDGTRQIVIIAHADLAGDGKAARESLANAGYQMSATREGRTGLSEYILSHPAEKIFDIATQFGWSDNFFIFADEIISPPETDPTRRGVLFDNNTTTHSFASSGTLEAWHRYANLAQGNPLMLMFLAAAFAGPLLELLKEEAGGLHLYGLSSRGKTTLVWHSATVWGSGGEKGFSKSWHATQNGAEGLAYVHNDTFLVLDELGQGAVENVQALIYLFGNGQGKLRANKTGALGASQHCRTFVVSTGEESISGRIRSNGLRGANSQIKAGAAVRMIDIPAAPADGVGLFEDLHGHENEAAFVAALRAGSLENYGFAGPAFVRELVADRTKHTAFCKNAIAEFVSVASDDSDDPQTVRCARRFALVAAAGSLAEYLGILPFAAGTCRAGILECFERWKLDQVPQKSREERDVIERTRRFLAAHGDNRFDQIIGSTKRADDTEDDVQLSNLPKHNRAGYFKEEDGVRTYFVLPAVFEDEICADYDSKMAGRVLRASGFLIAGEGNRICKNVRVPDLDRPMRLYAIRSSIISDDT